MTRITSRRTVLPLLLAAATFAALPAAAVADSCAGSAPETTLCLINGERAGHGVAPLRPDAKLASVATAYANDLVAGSYFSHTGRDGSSAFDRIERGGYIPDGAGWVVGENLGWGTGELATPAAMMSAWMNSPGHRANILNPEFREIGIGIADGNPAADDGLGATYATEFGALYIDDTVAAAQPRRDTRRARKRRRRARRIRARHRRHAARARHDRRLDAAVRLRGEDWRAAAGARARPTTRTS